ncbi:unnamed protein product [marine sediment metagenome]|uniref:Peptidase S8/S53 domain-containing protein n=1 Tax=marine sediment metagenome TaxID=412755 RepID=X1FNK3_9ZZZZ
MKLKLELLVVTLLPLMLQQQIFTPLQLLSMIGLVDLQSLTVPPLYGQGSSIAVLDTGMRITHEQLGGMVVFSKNYTSDTTEDSFDHGTGVASIIHAVAPLSGILNMKVNDDKGDGTSEEVVEAIEDCIDLVEIESSIALFWFET